MDPSEAMTFRGGPFSNFAATPVELACPHTGRVRVYATVEHWFQACKALTLEDHLAVANAPTPREAKRRGRRVLLRADWEDIKFEVMLDGLRAKFSDPQLAKKLLATGDRVIAENSPTDFEWGARDDAGGWTGENRMGQALMLVREELRRSRAAAQQLQLQIL